MADYDSEKSEFNYAVNFLKVLLGLELKAMEARDNKNASDWYDALVNMNSHLAPDMTEDEDAKTERFRTDNQPKIQNWLRTQKYGISQELYNALYQWEKYLKGISKRKNYRGKMEDDFLTSDEW